MPRIIGSRRSRQLAAVALWSALPLVAMAVPARATTLPAHNGRIAYVDTVPHSEDGHNQVFTIRNDRAGRRQLTHRGDSDEPAWGPEGRRIAYVHWSPRPHIWVMDQRGRHKRQLTGGPHNADQSPAWAPGGGRIVFVRGGRNSDLFVYSFRAGHATPLHVGNGFDLIPLEPTWSPDGLEIAFVGLSKGNGTDEPQSDIYLVHPDGTGLTQVTHTSDMSEESPDWSPDSSRIAYQRDDFTGDNDCEAIYTIHPDGSQQTLVHAGCSAEAPVWSPDGRRLLALLSARRVGLFTMSPDGAHRHFVVFGFEADWQTTSR